MICSVTLQTSGQDLEKRLDSVSYFPRQVYAQVANKVDSMMVIWRSQMLHAFDEPKLNSHHDNTVFRFTWTRSFHEAIVIRLSIAGDPAILITKTEVPKPEQPIEPVRRRKKKHTVPVEEKLTYRIDSLRIGQSTITDFTRLVEEKGLWKMQTYWDTRIFFDGSGWLLEATDKEKGYRMVYHRSPGEDKKNFKDICLFLIRLTKGSEKLEVY
jgi:hypothetical protein